MSQYQALKQACYEANMQLPKLGLVLFTFGNASVVDRERSVFAIKPSGVPYAALTPDDIVIVDFEGNAVEGSKRPSSDTKTHALLFKQWPEIGGIVHTHSTYATAWAQAQLDIPILGTTHADHLTADVPCAPPAISDQAISAGTISVDRPPFGRIATANASRVLVSASAPDTGSPIQSDTGFAIE